MTVGSFILTDPGLLAQQDSVINPTVDTMVGVLVDTSHGPPQLTEATYADISADECQDADYAPVVLNVFAAQVMPGVVKIDQDVAIYGSPVTISARYYYILRRAGASLVPSDEILGFMNLSVDVDDNVDIVDGTFAVAASPVNGLYQTNDSGDIIQECTFDDQLEGYSCGGLHKNYTGNLNDITINSKLAFLGTSVTNEPGDFDSSEWGHILTMMSVDDVTVAQQVIYGLTGANIGKVWRRADESGTFTAWVLDPSKTYVDTQDGLLQDYVDAADLVLQGQIDTNDTDIGNIQTEQITQNNRLTQNESDIGDNSTDIGTVAQALIDQKIQDHADVEDVTPDNADVLIYSTTNNRYEPGPQTGGGGGSGDPIGTVKMWPAATPPADHFICNGQAIDRTTFVDLFTVIGTDYGVGDGTTTFNIPDYRGQFMRGTDSGRGLDPDAAGRTGGDNVGSTQGFENASHTHAAAGDHQHASSGDHGHASSGDHGHTSAGDHGHAAAGGHTHTSDGTHSHTSAGGHTHNTIANHTHAAAGDHGHASSGSHTHASSGAHQHAATGDHFHEIPRWESGPNQDPDTYVEKDTDDSLTPDVITNKMSTVGNHQHASSGSHTHAATGAHTHANAGSHSHAAAGGHTHTTDGAHTHPSAGSHTHNAIANHTHANAGAHVHPNAGTHTHANAGAHTHASAGSHSHAASGGLETRPVNINITYIIQAL